MNSKYCSKVKEKEFKEASHGLSIMEIFGDPDKSSSRERSEQKAEC